MVRSKRMYAAVAATVAGMGLVWTVGTARGGSLGPTKASNTFSYRYEGDALPDDASYSSLGFVLNDPNEIVGQTVSLGTASGVDFLKIDTDTTNATSDVISYRADGGPGTAWDPGYIGPWTIEMRAIVHPNNAASYGAGLQMRDLNSAGLFQFWHNKVVGPLGDTVTTDPNSDTWHTFRIASYSPDDSSAGQIYVMWRDGVQIATFANNAQFNLQYIEFGDFVSYFPEINVDYDYLRWDTTGAYQPVVGPTEPTWITDGSGDWNDPANWSPSVPNAVGDTAIFGSAITSAQTVTANSAVTVGTLKFDNNNTYQIAGNGSLTIEVASGAGSVSVVKGSHTINLPLFFASDTTVDVAGGATLTIGDPATIRASKTVTKTGDVFIEAPLTLEAGATLVTAGGQTTLFGAPSLGTGAKIDIKNNSVTVDYRGQTTPATTIKDQIAANGIMSSSAIAGQTGVGWVDDSASQSILVKYTYLGDTNLDGQVDVIDLGNLATAWQTSGVWANGDSNYDNFVDVIDLGMLATNWQSGVGNPLGPGSLDQALAAYGLPSVSVPEPESVMLVGAVAGLLRSRKRRN